MLNMQFDLGLCFIEMRKIRENFINAGGDVPQEKHS